MNQKRDEIAFLAFKHILEMMQYSPTVKLWVFPELPNSNNVNPAIMNMIEEYITIKQGFGEPINPDIAAREIVDRAVWNKIAKK